MRGSRFGTDGGRLQAARDWRRRRADSSGSRLALAWLNRYVEASRNAGAAATVYLVLSAVPTALVVIAYFHLAGGDEGALAENVIERMKLDATTADLVRETFGVTSGNALAATIAAVLGFLLWGLGVGQIYQDVLARAWRIHVRSRADQARYAAWFSVTSGLLGLGSVAAASLDATDMVLLLAAWFVGLTAYWLWTAHLLLHGRIGMLALLPGALLASFVTGGTLATAPLWVGPSLSRNGAAFGPFGIILALLVFVFVFVTITMACAVFSPVWAEWRRAERERRRQASGTRPGGTRNARGDVGGS